MTTPARIEPPAPAVDDEVLRYLGLPRNNPATRALVLLADRYRLDPLIGEIQIISTKQGAKVYISRDGLLAIAHRSGMLDGIVVTEQRRNSAKDGWTAYVEVWRKDMAHPFKYGAQCKDAEKQAQAGNGPEMALARAERRALRRAFSVTTDFVPASRNAVDYDVDVDDEIIDAELADSRFADGPDPDDPTSHADEGDLDEGRPFDEDEP